MKRNFNELKETEKANFAPQLYMIMGNADGITDGWDPMAWSPEWVEENSGEKLPAQLAWADGQEGEKYITPFNLYDLETAKKYILDDCLLRGIESTGHLKTKPIHYRIIPVYTGLEQLLQPRVMIFCESPNGTIAPCEEWPANIDYEERTPLAHKFGFKSIDPGDKDYSIPTYSAEYAQDLIERQTFIEQQQGDHGWRYFTVPVSNPL